MIFCSVIPNLVKLLNLPVFRFRKKCFYIFEPEEDIFLSFY